MEHFHQTGIAARQIQNRIQGFSREKKRDRCLNGKRVRLAATWSANALDLLTSFMQQQCQ